MADPSLSFIDIVGLVGFLAQIIGVFGMFSAIWVVQMIVYPSFLDIDAKRWEQFHHRHCRRMGFIVGPLMCCELLGGIAFVSFLILDGNSATVLSYSIALPIISILTWLITAILFIPLHRSLGENHDPALIQSLVKQNWIRTFLWSLAAIVWIARIISL